MKPEKYILSILLTILVNLTYSQNDWRPGFIITNDNDTIPGYVDYRPNKENSLRCFFRRTEQGKTELFNPGEIRGYRYADGKFYISRKVNINNPEKTYFLEFLLQGKVNAYYLKLEKGMYFIEKDGKLYELKNTEAIVIVDGKEYLKEKKEYIGTMNYVLQEAEIRNDINRTKLEHKQVITISKKYHEKVCTDEECIIFEKQVKPVTIDVGFIAGSNMHTLYLYDDLSYELKMENSFFGGVGFNFRNMPMIYERFSFNLEILMNRYYMNDAKYLSLNIPFLLDYKILANKLSPRVEAGISTYFIRNNAIKTGHLSLVAGISFQLEYHRDNRIFINARYERNPGILRMGFGLYF